MIFYLFLSWSFYLSGCKVCRISVGRSVRFADLPPETPQEGKRKKKRLVKKTKAITPLQAMMLRMAGNVLLPEADYFLFLVI